MAALWAKVKAWAKWVYDWITVLTASLVGLPGLLLDLLNYVGAVDISPFIGADKALKIVTLVAIVKGLLAFIASRLQPKAVE